MPASKDKDKKDVEELLPELQHREVIDALVMLFAKAGMPESNTVSCKLVDILNEMGKDRSGKNYKVVYDAIVKYYRMEMKVIDMFNQRKGRKPMMPYETAVRIIASYKLQRPDTWGQKDNDRQQLEVKFESWFADSFRAKNEVLFVEQALLLAIGVGYTRRVFEVVRKGMGDSPVFKIGIEKLGKALPFVRELEARRQVETLKRAVRQLTRIGAFSKFEVTGRGMDTIFVFYSAVPGRGAGNIEAEFVEIFGGGPNHAERTLHKAEALETRLLPHGPSTVISPKESNYLNVVGELMHLIVTTEIQDKNSKDVGEVLTTTRISVMSYLTKHNFEPSFVRDVFEDTKYAHQQGKVKTTIRQYFLDQLKRSV